MSTTITPAGIATQSTSVTDVMTSNDIGSIVNYYSQFVTVAYTPPARGQRITVNDYQQLRAAIINGFEALSSSTGVTYTYAAFPSFSAGKIPRSQWPAPAILFQGATMTFTSPGTYTFRVPVGATMMTLVEMIAGGGGGGGGYDNGGTGGSGGSGGYMNNVQSSVNYLQTITVVVGVGGGGILTSWGNAGHGTHGEIDYGTTGFMDPAGAYVTLSGVAPIPAGEVYRGMDGGNSVVSVDNVALWTCVGGGGGLTCGYYDRTGALGGTAGTPNGNPGMRGSTHSNGSQGAAGANSQLGTGGIGGVSNDWHHGPTGSDGNEYLYGLAFGQNASGYGAGGGGCSIRGHSQPYQWGGGAGSGGYCKLTFS